MAEDQSYSKEMPEKGSGPLEEQLVELPPLDETKKGRWERSWPTIACGAGLFSDGYLNQVCYVSSSWMQPHSFNATRSLLTHLDLGHWSRRYYAATDLRG